MERKTPDGHHSPLGFRGSGQALVTRNHVRKLICFNFFIFTSCFNVLAMSYGKGVRSLIQRRQALCFPDLDALSLARRPKLVHNHWSACQDIFARVTGYAEQNGRYD